MTTVKTVKFGDSERIVEYPDRRIPTNSKNDYILNKKYPTIWNIWQPLSQLRCEFISEKLNQYNFIYVLFEWDGRYKIRSFNME